MVLPAATVDCCLSSLRAGVCSLLWRWRFSALVVFRAGIDGRLSSSPSGEGVAPSPVPWMLIASTGFRSIMG